MLGVMASGVWLAAHEGHDTAPLKPVFKQVQIGDAIYRVGFAMLPQDPLVGEDVRFEIQFVQIVGENAGAVAVKPIAATDARVQIVSAAEPPRLLPAASPAEKPGTYTVRDRFDERGQYGVAARVETGSTAVGAEFPIVVGPGPVLRAGLVIDALVVLLFGALIWSRWRGRGGGQEAGSPRLARDALTVGVGIAALAAAHVWIGPRVGRLFLPERHFGPIAWDTGTRAAGSEPAAAPHTHPEGTPPHDHPDEKKPAPHTHPPGTKPHSHDDASAAPARPALTSAATPAAASARAREIVSTVVPMPGRLADVMVPMSARVLFEGFTPRVGRAVKRGQTMAVLEHHYVLHDAVHLINQRWLYLMPMLDAKRKMLDAQLQALRLRYLHETGDASVRQMMEVTQDLPAADMAAIAARLEHERAVKLLGMHDAQIGESELVRRPVTSPIDGVIETVAFTQGQLKYEHDKLFTILDLSRVWVEARFPEELASRKPPARMTFTSQAFPGRRFEGRLARVAETLDPATGTVSAFFEVANPDRLLRVGMRLASASATDSRTAPPVETPAVETTRAPRPGAPVLRTVSVTSSADEGQAPPVLLAGTIKAKPELSADVTAPLWGRLEFAGRSLNVGDRVRKGEDLVHVVLELSVDERYPMAARAYEIKAAHEMAKARRGQAEKQWRDAGARLAASPDVPFRKADVQLTERIHQSAQEEEALLAKQIGVFDGVMKRRDPKVTVVQAPISGIITEIGFRPGDLNPTGEFRKLLTIVDTSQVWLEAPVYDHQSAAILRGAARASFTSPGLSSTRPLDRPAAVSGAIDAETGTLRVIYDVSNPGGALKIGASAQIVVPRG